MFGQRTVHPSSGLTCIATKLTSIKRLPIICTDGWTCLLRSRQRLFSLRASQTITITLCVSVHKGFITFSISNNVVLWYAQYMDNVKSACHSEIEDFTNQSWINKSTVCIYIGKAAWVYLRVIVQSCLSTKARVTSSALRKCSACGTRGNFKFKYTLSS